MNKKEFQDLVYNIYNMYLYFNGYKKFYYGGKYHTRDETKQDLIKFDGELARKFDTMANAHEEFATYFSRKIS